MRNSVKSIKEMFEDVSTDAHNFGNIIKSTDTKIIESIENISSKISESIESNNNEINRNAVVFEKHGEKRYRVYLMDKDKDIDIRDFFKYRSVSSPDYILHPDFYIKGRNEPVGNKYPYKTEFEDKKEFIFYVNQMVTELNKREWNDTG